MIDARRALPVVVNDCLLTSCLYRRGQVPPAGFEYVRLRAHEKAKLDGSGIDWRALCGEEEQRQEEEEQDDDAGS